MHVPFLPSLRRVKFNKVFGKKFWRKPPVLYIYIYTVCGFNVESTIGFINHYMGYISNGKHVLIYIYTPTDRIFEQLINIRYVENETKNRVYMNWHNKTTCLRNLLPVGERRTVLTTCMFNTTGKGIHYLQTPLFENFPRFEYKMDTVVVQGLPTCRRVINHTADEYIYLRYTQRKTNNN